MKKFKPGDSVKVKADVKDPDFGSDVSGWQGRIVDIEPEPSSLVEIQWDSLTLQAMPEDLISRCFQEELYPEIMILDVEELELTQPRDKETDVFNALQKLYADYGLEYQAAADSMVEAFFSLVNDGDDEEDDEWGDDDFGFFDLEEFFAVLEINAKKEQKQVETCFARGLEAYYNHIYGYDKYGKHLNWLINERMQEPYIFGYGMVEVLRHEKISDATKAKIAHYTLQIINPDLETGIPYGLIVSLSFVAQKGMLPANVFRAVMHLTQIDREWGRGWQMKEAISLSEWLITTDKMPQEEKIWWLWYFVLAFEYNAQTGKKVVDFWLTHPGLSVEERQELCWAWLSKDKRPGTPPPTWRLAEAQYEGNIDLAGRLMRELGATEAEIAQLQQQLGDLHSDPMALWLAPQAPTFIDPVMTFIFMPNWIKRLAVPALIRLGEDAVGVCTLFLDHDRDYGSEAANQGVADAIKEFHDQLPPDEIRRLIEKGIAIPQVPTRKTFYALSTEFYGKEFLLKTQEDNAASVRKWGAKQLQKFEA